MAENTLAAPSPATVVAEADVKPKVRRERRTFPPHPDDFDDAESFLQYLRKLYDKDHEADENNRKEMIQDARFVAGDQWDPAVKQRRDSASKPTLTINRLPAYVAQLVGNRRLNDIGIKIIPDTGGTKKVADVREGLIRSIQKLSRAQYAYDKAFEQQVIGGLGNFQVRLEYAHDDVFEQDIRIDSIPNPLAVVWDQNSVEPTGADASHVFVVDRVPRRAFKKRYPNAVAGEWESNMDAARSYGWDTSDTVQIVSFWRMRTKTRTVALMVDGSVQDVTDIEEDVWWDKVVENDGIPMVRDVQRKYAQMYLCTSQDLLAGPYDLPITRVPVFRVPGWELFVEGDRIRWGLIRFLRDPQKLHNYWRSTVAEKLVSTPKAKWVASDAAVEGHEDQWRKSHLTDDPLLVYNGESGAPPTRVPPVEMEAALIQEAGMAAQDIKDVSNIHEASLGMQSNEVSGRAIMARQRVGEVGTVIYQDNLNMAIEEAGKVVNELIPFVYDTKRMIKVLGPDMMTEKLVPINGYGESADAVDITCGKYAVSVVTGPSYVTRRVESREEMMGMVNAMPETMAVAADLIVDAQDWPGAEKIARRLRSQLPPGMVSEDELSDEEREAAALQQQNAQEQQAFQAQVIQLDLAEKAAKVKLAEAQAEEAAARTREALARAEQAEAQARKAIASIEIERDKLEVDRAKVALQTVETFSNADNGANRGS